ncbi:PREDICTED: sodium channel modifier 1-like [Priapulus caudatus]|uniref:Sodium channel modifier 1-like n=1 Tax=Priapulus caudatus TaxID=37621 RepID=A0ABM1EMX5_PRICU|nr:PREDICTED: sodium channel modifier 1-like [Priapulus caudatus]
MRVHLIRLPDSLSVKYILELERFVDKKGELDALILKRQHAEYDKDGRVTLDAKKVKSAGVLGPGLLPSATYSSRNKQKKKSVLFRRKMVVDLKARSAKAVANSRPLTSNANSRSTTARDMNPSKKSSVSNSAATCEQKLAAENSKSSEKDTVVYVHKQYRSASESLNSRRPHVDVAVADVHKRKQLEHYLHLKSCGWKKSNDGQWIKDELVEFDSDEDEPPTVDMISH